MIRASMFCVCLYLYELYPSASRCYHLSLPSTRELKKFSHGRHVVLHSAENTASTNLHNFFFKIYYHLLLQDHNLRAAQCLLRLRHSCVRQILLTAGMKTYSTSFQAVMAVLSELWSTLSFTWFTLV